MKRTLPGLFCLVFAARLVASEAFLLQIPKRGIDDQEIGEVRITLGLDLPPAGAQLVVNGTPVNLGATATIAGDEVQFAEGDGNTVRITYKPLSNFGADFCAGANAAEKNVKMTFSGAQDVLNYRLSTYVVAAPQFGPGCTKVSKRVGELPANVIPEPDGATPLLEATFRGRHELDVILVLDRSGSMGEQPPGATASPSKATLLRSALSTFVAQWAELDAPFEGAGEWPNDRIGVVFFHNNAAMQPIAGGDPPAGQLVRRGDPAPSHPWAAVSATIDTLTPGLTTALGQGINTATSAWLADPKNDLALVVVTDGKQNVDPLITTSATNGLLELAPPAGISSTLAARFIPTQTIGFGIPAAVDEALLKAVSEQTAGVSFIAVDQDTMVDSFAFTLVALLKGNTASLAARAREITSGEHQVLVDRSAARVVFSLQWAPPAVDALSLEVFRPGAIDHATPDSITRTKQSVLYSFVTKPGDVGTWRAKVQPTMTPANPVPYTLNTFFNERNLDESVSFDTTRTRTGEPIRIRAIVAYDGKPLKGLPPNAIRMRVRRPLESLGTILHNAANTGTSVGSSDPQSPYQLKVAAVVDASVLPRIRPTAEIATIPFTEESSGIYSATFSDTSIAGVYGFDITLDWDDPRTGHLHREERLERQVSVLPDRGMTDVRQRGDLVLVTPRDRFGNYVGPGYATGFNVAATDPQQTGTYEVNVTPGTAITFDGVTLQPPTTAKSWRVFLAAGPNFPDWSVNAGVERLLSPAWSVEGIAGLHRRQNDDISQFSLGAKRWFGKAFLNLGAGVYDSEGGGHVGVGALCGKLELVWNVHLVDGDRFSTLQLGVRF